MIASNVYKQALAFISLHSISMRSVSRLSAWNQYHSPRSAEQTSHI